MAINWYAQDIDRRWFKRSGRADRFTEPAHDRLTSVVSGFVEVIKRLLN